VLLGIVEGNPLLQALLSRGQLAEMEKGDP
jgi:hypothetical protein